MIRCPKCDATMVRAELYEPEGTVLLHGGEQKWEDGKLTEWLVCINPTCDDGRRNTSGMEQQV